MSYEVTEAGAVRTWVTLLVQNIGNTWVRVGLQFLGFWLGRQWCVLLAFGA
jgi:hypothetical protein